VELIVLGSYGPWPGAGGASSGYLLREDGYTLMLEVGSGTLARAQEHVRVSEIDAVVISHAHGDHFLDLYPLFFSRFFDPDSSPELPLYCPPGFFDHAMRIVSQDTLPLMDGAFDVREIPPGQVFEAGPFRVETRPMTHLVTTLGMRITAGHRVFAYTADTGPTEEVNAIARDADLLMAEATWQDADDLQWFHLSARQAAEHASRSDAGRLLLTHTYPNRDRDASREQAAEAFVRDVKVATEGMTLEIGG
jgi:ribonuclease BN (tRNA processing enzyme)